MKSTEPFISNKSEYYNYQPSVTARNAYFYPLCLGHFYYSPGYKQFRNSYDSFLILYVVSGTFFFESDKRTFQASKNQIVLIDCYKPHGYSLSAEGECLWFHFDGPVARNYYDIILSKTNSNVIGADKEVLALFYSLYNPFNNKLPVKEAYMSKILSDILTSMILIEQENSSTNSSLYIEKAISYINENFNSNISIEALAKNVSLSPYYFIRLFKKETGFTPHEYILNKRLNTAKYLLKSTNLSVKDICFNTGFSSESVFCTAFKQKSGITPAQYRTDEIPL